MFIVESYPLAIALCIITMICWGSWANTQKLTGKQWPFQLFYWDYCLGVLLLSLLLAFMLGSHGEGGRSFLPDLAQAETRHLASAFLGGVIFNLSNILLVAAIDIAGMAVAFPVGVGLALGLGVVTTYLSTGEGNPFMLGAGVTAIAIAIVLDALAYKRLSHSGTAPMKGIVLAIIAGLLMGFFYKYVAQAMSGIDAATRALEPGKLSPYTAIVLFSSGVLLSSFARNTFAMWRPFTGARVSFADYFTKGTPRLQHHRQHEGGCRALVWTRPGRDDGRSAVGRVCVEGVQSRAVRHQQAARCDVCLLPHWPRHSHRVEKLNPASSHARLIPRRPRQFEYRHDRAHPYAAASQ